MALLDCIKFQNVSASFSLCLLKVWHVCFLSRRGCKLWTIQVHGALLLEDNHLVLQVQIVLLRIVVSELGALGSIPVGHGRILRSLHTNILKM